MLSQFLCRFRRNSNTRAKKNKSWQAERKQTKPVDELTKLREEFVKAANEYKANLEKLRASYEKDVVKAEEELIKSNALFAGGLISKNQLEVEQQAVAKAKTRSLK